MSFAQNDQKYRNPFWRAARRKLLGGYMREGEETRPPGQTGFRAAVTARARGFTGALNRLYCRPLR